MYHPSLGRVWLIGMLVAAAVVGPLAAAERESAVLLEGTRWGTPYYIQKADEDGPVVLPRANVPGLEADVRDQSLSYRARQNRVMVHALLRELDMIDEDLDVETGPADQIEYAAQEQSQR